MHSLVVLATKVPACRGGTDMCLCGTLGFGGVGAERGERTVDVGAARGPCADQELGVAGGGRACEREEGGGAAGQLSGRGL